MRRATGPGDLAFQVATLLISFTLVHAVYAVAIRPQANAILAEQAERMRTDPGYVPERSIKVILRDYEQESEFVLMLWALFILAENPKRSSTR